MSDIVERLRNHALPDPNDEREVLHAPLLREAAEELERLRAKLGPLVEDRICLICGRTEPCMTDEESIANGGPGAPCTFDPTAQQLWDAN